MKCSQPTATCVCDLILLECVCVRVSVCHREVLCCFHQYGGDITALLVGARRQRDAGESTSAVSSLLPRLG